MFLEDEDIPKILKQWHDDYDLGWREIADLPDFRGIVWSTLSSYANGRKIVNPIHREIFHLRPKENCGMCWVFNKYIKEATYRPLKWRSLPQKVLKLALENREEVEWTSQE